MPSDATEAALGLLGLNPSCPPPPPSISSKRKQPPAADNDPSSSESINCICGITLDDGFSIGCDSCARWCHAACFNIVENEIPEEWQCWICAPRPVDKDDARRIQNRRQRILHKRKPSPGVDRKPRKPTAAASDNKRKRRPSINHPHEDEHVDIEELCYVPINKDIVTSDDARGRLRRLASNWRGISAIDPSPPSLPPGSTTPVIISPDAYPPDPQITLQPVPNSSATFPFSNGDLSVRPPSFALHAAAPIESSKLITTYPSTIIPTAAYLRDPLNAYAHLGMPKPYVHLFGPPLDVALDSRITGDRSRFVRNGCRPNAILRPMFCHSQQAPSVEEDTIRFGIFALRDLKPNEEVVLGWEWDDGNVVHNLPALIENPFAFPPHQLQHFRNQMTSMLHALASTFTTCACGAKARDCVLSRIADFVENQTPLTPSPSPPSQFSKEKEKNTAKGHGKAERLDEQPIDLGPLIAMERGFRTRERIPSSGGMGGVELVPDTPEAGPSQKQLGTREVFPDAFIPPSVRTSKGKDRKRKLCGDENESDSHGESYRDHGPARGQRRSTSVEMDVDGPPVEEHLPPKLRKTWIAKSAERLRGRRYSDGSLGQNDDGLKDDSYFDSRHMPPPPLPSSRTPPLSSTSASHYPPPSLSASTSSSSASSSSSSKSRLALDGQASPSLPFSKLSLLSPVVSAPNGSSSRADAQSLAVASPSPSVPVPKVKRRLTSSAQLLSDAGEPSKLKGKEKEQDTGKFKEKVRAKGKGASRKTSRMPVTEQDESLLKPSLIRRESLAKSERSHSPEAMRSPSLKSTSAPHRTPTPPPPPTAVIVGSNLPLDPLQEMKSLVADPRVDDPPFLGPQDPDQVFTDAFNDKNEMHIDQPPSPSPLPDISVPVFTLPVLCPNVRDTSPVSAISTEPTAVAGSLTPPPSPIRSVVPILDEQTQPAVSEVTEQGPLIPSTEHSPTKLLREPTLELLPPVVAVEARAAPSTDDSQRTAEANAVETPLVPDANDSACEPILQPTDVHPPPSPDEPQPHVPMEVDPESTSHLGSGLPPVPPLLPQPPPPLELHSEPPSDDHDSEQPRTSPAPTKVKLSLKDFAMRRKKQREEQVEREKGEMGRAAVSSPQLPSMLPLLGASSEMDTGPGTGGLAETSPRIQEDGLVAVNGDSRTGDGDPRRGEEEETRDVEDPTLSVGVEKYADGGPSIVQLSSPVESTAAAQHDCDLRHPVAPEGFYSRQTQSPAYERRSRFSSEDSDVHREAGADDISLQAKVELLESFVPTGVASARTPSPVDAYSPTEIRDGRVVSPLTPPRTSPRMTHSRVLVASHPSQEDGEIFSPPPPKPPPLAPRSHSPPTHPRLFFANEGVSPSRRSPPPPPARRPLQPTQYARTRMVPSAPRALRGERAGYGGGPVMYPSQNAPHFAPRGPSVDRERERGRDWGRERDGERAWIPGPSRGRGRGSWGR